MRNVVKRGNLGRRKQGDGERDKWVCFQVGSGKKGEKWGRGGREEVFVG